MSLGDRKKEAANLVARHVAYWPGITGAKISATTIAKWRNDHLAGDRQSSWQFHSAVSHILRQPDPRRETMKLLNEYRVLPKNVQIPP